MAESVGSLYLRLGLNLSELETGFVTASQTVAANISRLNRESQLIRIRSQVEIEGLDEVADAERIAQIRTTALNQQLTIQRDRVRILSAELQSVTAAHGANSAATQRATIRLERERLALAQLESELQNLQRTQGETTRSFGGLSDIVENMPPQLKAMAAGIMAVGTATGAAGKSVTELLENFRELQQQSYELNMSVGKTRDLLRHLRLGGGDIGDFEGYIRGITDAFVKGEVDDPEFIALRKYGAEITDATGRLKDFKAITEEVYQAWLKADAAGEGIEFLQLTGGESGIRDAIQFFKRYEEALADAKKISKAGIDETQLHELDRAMNLVAEQAGELKNALGDIFVPAAQSAAQSFFEILKTATEILTENKDAIQSLGFIAKETFKTVGDEISSAFSLVGEKISTVNEMLKGKTGDLRIDKTLGDMSWRYGVPKSVFGVDKMISGQVDDAKKSYGVLNDVVKRGRQSQAEYNAKIARTPELWQKVVKTISGGDKNPLNQYAAQRIQSFRDELEELRIELDFEDEIEKAKAQLDLWFDREFTRKNFLSDDEKTAIRDLYGAKLEQIQREEKAALEETAARAQEHWRNAADIQYSMTHTAFEKELRDIELWKEAQREKADTAEEISGIIAEAAAKEADAFEREVDRIKGKVQSLEDKIFEQEHSRYENDLRKLAQERYQLYQEEIYSPVMIERYYQNALSKLKSQAAQGGDYTKSPTSDGKQRGGNGIVVIGGDQIIDDGLIKAKQAEIGLLVDENKIRAQVLAGMSESERQLVAAQVAMRNFANVQSLPPPAEKSTSGYQIIEGDKIVEMPETTAYLQEFNSALQQTTSEIEQIAMPQELPMQEISTEPLQEFKAALERISSEVERLNPFEPIANAGNFLAERLNQAAQDLPTEYFRNLADGAKSVSTMQLSLTDSTMKLIDAQENLRNVIKNLPSNAQMETKMPTDGFRQLSTSTQDFMTMQQDLLNRRTRELERLPASQPQSKGLNFGFDMDTAGTVLGLGALIAGIGGAPITAPIAAGIAALSALGGLAKGTYDNTTEIPNANTFENIDLMQLSAPLANVDANVQSILHEMQVPQETTLSFETIVTPLNTISNVVGNILAALNNRGSQPINISPNMNIDLGGAYVFDESLKKSLVDDITNKIVTAITSAVEQATGQFRNYSYGA